MSNPTEPIGSNKFISSDKKTINLPVPIGTTVYMSNTSCSDVCVFQKELVSKFNDEIKCDRNAICHTNIAKTTELVLSLRNLEQILSLWNECVFETKTEADNKTRQITTAHTIEMKVLGFKLDNKGYSVVPKPLTNKNNDNQDTQ